MGLENRDYYRDGSYTSSLVSLGLDFTPAVKYLILANVVVFVLQIFFTRPALEQFPDGVEPEASQTESAKDAPPDKEKQKEVARKAREEEKTLRHFPGMSVSVVQEWCELDPKKTILQGQVWRLLTCAFCHDRLGVWHILMNMLLLYWFGTRLESMYGSREFLLFYLTAAVCGSLAYAALALYSGSNAPAIGASGAVMGVMMLYVIYYPFERILLFWFIPVPLWALLSLYVLYDLHPVLLALAGDTLYTGVAHAGHLGGLMFGFVYWKAGWRLETLLGEKWKAVRLHRAGMRPRPRPAEREPVVLPFPEPERDELAERVDEVLKKISEQGKDSLTDEERDLLIQASEKYRSRR